MGDELAIAVTQDQLAAFISVLALVMALREYAEWADEQTRKEGAATKWSNQRGVR